MINDVVSASPDALGSKSEEWNSSTDAPAVVFEHVTKRFPSADRAAVDDVSLEVAPGTLVVLLGPSGCGKTTLLKMVNRLYEHDAGRVLVEGREARSFKVTDLRRRIGYVIQSTGLFPHMTVAKNIATVPDMLGWDKARTNRRIDELLALVGMPTEQYRERYPAQLSGGQQQRVGLARALAADPSIMLMDEPFAAIDNITRRRLQDELLDIQREVRKTILFVTHDVDEAIRLADRIAIMREGRVIQYDTPLHILSAPADDFVSELVGAKDVLRRLSLLAVDTVMVPISPYRSQSGTPVLPEGSSLREALSLLLSSNYDALTVVDGTGNPVGVVDLSSIRRATHEHER
ncbi:MAG: ABC transporter ATP-binding protein [Chloroflexi bacterium]|nr:ABC transporter ATP-binding protein [Chloroflexota bacterium]